MPIDWDAIERDYVYGIVRSDGRIHFPSMKELCAKYGVKYATLACHISRKNLAQKRRQIQSEYMITSFLKTQDDEIQELTDEDMIRQVARTGIKVCKLALQQVAESESALELINNVRTVSEALKNFVAIFKSVQGPRGVGGVELYEVEFRGLEKGFEDQVSSSCPAEGSDASPGSVQDTGLRSEMGKDDTFSVGDSGERLEET